MVRLGEGSILFLGATVRIHLSPVGEPAGRKVFEAGNELQTLKCPPLLHHGQTNSSLQGGSILWRKIRTG